MALNLPRCSQDALPFCKLDRALMQVMFDLCVLIGRDLLLTLSCLLGKPPHLNPTPAHMSCPWQVQCLKCGDVYTRTVWYLRHCDGPVLKFGRCNGLAV